MIKKCKRFGDEENDEMIFEPQEEAPAVFQWNNLLCIITRLALDKTISKLNKDIFIVRIMFMS